MTKAEDGTLEQRAQKAVRHARAEIRQREGRNTYYLPELIADAQADFERKERAFANSRTKLYALVQEREDNDLAIDDLSRMVETLHDNAEELDAGVVDQFAEKISRYNGRNKTGRIAAIHSGF